MALTLSEYEDLRDELIRARLNPHARMSDGVKQIVSKNDGDINRAIAWVDAVIAGLKGEKRVPRKRHYVTRTGW